MSETVFLMKTMNIYWKKITGCEIKIQNKSGREHRAKYTHTHIHTHSTVQH